MVFALIPAGGKSTRMGRPKLLLPLGESSVLEHVIRALRQGDIRDILVVIASHLPEMQALAQEAGAHTLLLTQQTADMRATVEQGLRWLEERFRPQPDGDWLLVPADHPTLHSDVIRQLIQARQVYPERTIFVPTYQGRRGHPTLIRWSHCAGIQQHPAGQGLNTYLRGNAHETLEVPVDTPDILMDLDTPEDYERLRARWKGV